MSECATTARRSITRNSHHHACTRGSSKTLLDCMAPIQVMDVDPLRLMHECDNMEIVPTIGANRVPEAAAKTLVEILLDGRALIHRYIDLQQ